MKRREFLEAGLAGGSAVWLMSQTAGIAAPENADEIKVALIGAGSQGRVLLSSSLLVPGIRFRAVCDIWEYARNYGQNYLKTGGQEVNAYADYREMLDKEKGLQAAIVATPDFVHAEQVTACLKAGLHVYCEAPMAHSTDDARAMIKAMRDTGRLLQIGYQRRSNPRYLHACERLLREAELTGRVVQVNAQWVMPAGEDRGWPRRYAIADDVLRRYGYASMGELRNWMNVKKLGSGPFAGFAAHQIDAINWFLGAKPKSVLAADGRDYYKTRQWYDNVSAIYEYETAGGPVRALCQVLTTSSAGGTGHFEHFLGIDGSIKISENPKWTKLYREVDSPDWDDWISKGYVGKRSKAGEKPPTSGEKVVQETGQVETYELPVVLDKPAVQPHLQNFVDAVRGKAKLNCPADTALPAEIAVRKAYEAVEAKKMIEITAG